MKSIKNLNLNRLTFKQQKSLLGEMVRTDFKLRYQASVLGYLWSILKPLFLFAILYTVFAKVLRFGEGVPNYALSLLLGIVLWNFFTESTSSSLKSIVGRGSLIRKIDIPRYLIPISTVVSACINLFLNMTVIFIFLAFAEQNALSPATLIVLPLLILELFVVSLGVGFFLSALYVKLRDIDYIWEVLRQALFYTLPIIYPLSRIPSEFIQKIIMLNPLAQIIQDARTVVTYEGSIQIYELYGLFVVQMVPFILVILSVIIGVFFFMKKSKTFAENV